MNESWLNEQNGEQKFFYKKNWDAQVPNKLIIVSTVWCIEMEGIARAVVRICICFYSLEERLGKENRNRHDWNSFVSNTSWDYLGYVGGTLWVVQQPNRRLYNVGGLDSSQLWHCSHSSANDVMRIVHSTHKLLLGWWTTLLVHVKSEETQ